MSFDRITAALGSVAALVVIHGISSVMYNLFWSPLRSVPGSKWFAATPFPRLWLYFSGREPWTVKEMHERYGPIVRLAPYEVSFIDEKAWPEIYGYKATTHKDETFYPFSPGTKHSLILADDENHHRMRKMFLPAFSARALREQTELLNGYVTRLVKVLESKLESDNVVDLVKMYNLTTFDIMADLTFGESMGLLDTQEYSPWLQGIFDGIFYACISRAFQYFPTVWKIVQRFIPRSVHEAAEASVKHSADRVDKRLAMDGERPDIFGLVLKHETGCKMPRPEMHANADLLMIAGTETTATMLSGLTYNLLTNPCPMEKLTKEIRDSFKSADEITIDALPKLPYLSACLEEGLRTFPSVGEGVRRKTNATGATICGLYVPPNVGVSVPHFAAYRSAYNFTDSDSFVPERWLAPDSADFDPRFANDRKKVLQPFSTGPRNCLGMNLAYHEMRLIISHLLWNFDLELADRTDEDWLDQTAHVVWDKKPLFAKVSPRRLV